MLHKLVKRTFKKISSPSTIPKLPRFPLLDECCEKNCKECVWIDYFKQVERYRNYIKNKRIKTKYV